MNVTDMRTLLFFPFLFLFAVSSVSAEQNVSLEVDKGVSLRGTLLMPEGVVKPPVVLIIAGSGPTDRNGNNPQMQNNSLRNLAKDLRKEGIATFRYDKRMIGESAYEGMREEDATLGVFANDVRKLASMLYQDGRFSALVLVGHSEGAGLAVMAAMNNPEISKVVSIAGVGKPLDVTLIEQLERNPANPTDLIAEAKTILASLKKGERVAKISPALMPLFRPSVQPFVISQFRNDPAKNMAKLTLPVLLVQGGKDIQVTAADMSALAAAQPEARTFFLEDMNHVLKKTTATDIAGQLPAYTDPMRPNHEALAPAIAKFVKESGKPE